MKTEEPPPNKTKEELVAILSAIISLIEKRQEERDKQLRLKWKPKDLKQQIDAVQEEFRRYENKPYRESNNIFEQPRSQLYIFIEQEELDLRTREQKALDKKYARLLRPVLLTESVEESFVSLN